LSQSQPRRSRHATTAGAALRDTQAAIEAGDLEQALRLIDGAWRSLPRHSSQLAPIYARLLALDGANPQATLRMLARASEWAADPELAALTAGSLLRLARLDEARAELELALNRFCTVPRGLLATAATDVLGHASLAIRGWVGIGPSLEVHGVLILDEPLAALAIRRPDGSSFTQLVRTTSVGLYRAFRFRLPRGIAPAGLEITFEGQRLLGSNLSTPAGFALDARAQSRGSRVSGWCRLGWHPSRPLKLRLQDEHGATVAVRTGKVADGEHRHPFELDARKAGLRGNRLTISAGLPDGRWQPLPDAPLLLERALYPASRRPARLPGWKQLLSSRRRRSAPAPARAPSATIRAVDIIIPVYRGRADSIACIDAVLATVSAPHQIVVVDDATPDPALAAALDDYASTGRITLLRNPVNLGFVGSVNRALVLHPTHDAVLLNADTQVTGDWLQRLSRAAYASPDIATVTPLSNSGSIASYGLEAIDAAQAAALDTLAARTQAGARARVPVGVGFCLYMRRDCLEQVGLLDAQVFGRGYGEEVDYCLRAQSRGWSHWVAADVFVYHAGGQSFGRGREALLDRSQRLINLRYPGYDELIQEFLRHDPLSTLRRSLDEQRLRALDGRFALFTTLALSGGVDRHVAERVRQARDAGLLPLVLRPTVADDLSRCELWTDTLGLKDLRYRVPADLQALRTLLQGLRFERIEIQHFLHLDPRVIELVRSLDTPYDVYLHDYTWYCPRVTLIDGSSHYCGEPAVRVCETCVRRNGSHLHESLSVAALRARSQRWLHEAVRIVAPSHDTAGRFQRQFADLSIDVRPLSAVAAPAALPPREQTSAVTRVALIGALGDHKGYQVLLKCARDARARNLPLEFVVIGYTQDDARLLRTGKVFITGRYTDGEMPHLLKRERPDVAFYASVFPETWCYALDHALKAGLPIVAFDLGAIAERLRGRGGVELLPIWMSARRINDTLLQRIADQNTNEAVSDEIIMTESSQTPSQDTLSASIQVLPLPPGLYLFSVQAGAPKASASSGPLALPAVHVALGPGVSTDQVEFVQGSGNQGTWLFAKGDLLVAKVKGQGAMLLLNSLRAPGGDTLSIRVERLEARAAGAGAEAVLASPDASNALAPAPVASVIDSNQVSMRTVAHIRSRGDVAFTDAAWVGRVAPGLWVESFSIRPLTQVEPQDLEYKGLTGSGFETPWVSNEQSCGTKGMAVPLVGFAVRLKSSISADYECEYNGYFASGSIVGPLRNGAPCRSTVANDPLEGLQIRIVRRADASLAAARGKTVKASTATAGNDSRRGKSASSSRRS
jgi:GT2 family glycosyltransferase